MPRFATYLTTHR